MTPIFAHQVPCPATPQKNLIYTVVLDAPGAEGCPATIIIALGDN
jgi:hypothetical protein